MRGQPDILQANLFHNVVPEANTEASCFMPFFSGVCEEKHHFDCMSLLVVASSSVKVVTTCGHNRPINTDCFLVCVCVCGRIFFLFFVFIFLAHATCVKKKKKNNCTLIWPSLSSYDVNCHALKPSYCFQSAVMTKTQVFVVTSLWIKLPCLVSLQNLILI